MLLPAHDEVTAVKIVYLHRSPVPARSANSIQVMRTCEAFARLGHSVTLVVVDGAPEATDGQVLANYGVCGFALDRIPAYSRAGRIRRYARVIDSVRRARQHRPDLLYGRDPTTIHFATKVARASAIYEAHAPVDLHHGRMGRWAFNQLRRNRRLLGVVTNSSALREHFAATSPEFTVVCAPNAVHPPETSPVLPPGDRLRVGYAGHLYPGRGIDVIVDLASRCKWADFHLVGGEEDDLVLWRERTSSLANVTFHGFVPPAQVDAYLASFDILLAPYQEQVNVSGGSGDWARWMSPLKLAQYMAHGKPIICSDHSVLGDLVDSDVAILAPPADLAAWERALRDLAEHTERRQQLGAAALQRYEQCHTAEARARRILDALSADQ